nr:MAG TPA: hypothetical protein [Bacteriophage sp.]
MISCTSCSYPSLYRNSQQPRQVLKLSKVSRPSHYPLTLARCYVSVFGTSYNHFIFTLRCCSVPLN